MTQMTGIAIINVLEFCHEKIRTLIPDNFPKICEIRIRTRFQEIPGTSVPVCFGRYGINSDGKYRKKMPTIVETARRAFILTPWLGLANQGKTPLCGWRSETRCFRDYG